jgi:hypothetical protein
MADEDPPSAARAAPREPRRRGGGVSARDLSVVLRLAKRYGARKVRVGSMTIVLRDDPPACPTHIPTAPTRRMRGAGAAQAQQSARCTPARAA